MEPLVPDIYRRFKQVRAPDAFATLSISTFPPSLFAWNFPGVLVFPHPEQHLSPQSSSSPPLLSGSFLFPISVEGSNRLDDMSLAQTLMLSFSSFRESSFSSALPLSFSKRKADQLSVPFCLLH